MARYKTECGHMVSTEKSVESWDEDTRWDGNNHISVPTGSQWEHQELHLSSKGNYWILATSQWQGSMPSAYFISDEEAARWLFENNHDLPDNLKKYEADICE